MSHEAITAARHALNRAIVAKDADAIAELLAGDYHVVTALNSQRSGREESRRAWADMFLSDPAATFERIPVRIDVNEALGMAHENGQWNGTFRAAADPVDVSGVYSAKWVRSDATWLLLAEIFTPL
jgi:ketosteroid isomerase-like protein